MYKHTEVAAALDLSRQALDKVRRKAEQLTATDIGCIEDGARVYDASNLEQLRAHLSLQKRRRLDEWLARQNPIEAELLDEAPGLLAISNGFEAPGGLSFTSRSYRDMADHIEAEVRLSHIQTAQNLQSAFEALEESDKELGHAIGVKRLQNVFGTADTVFNAGLKGYAAANGLGKPGGTE